MTVATTEPSTANGTDPHVDFPVDSFKDAATHLRRPFTSKAVKFKVQATWPKGDPKQGLVVAYVDARTVVERLNHVCPHLWHDEYEALDGKRLMCLLTVDDITRRDVGEGYEGKGLYSDALKRAAVKFGVGVSLYAIPKMVLDKGTHLKDAQAGQTKTLALTDAGERRCRELYSTWLDEHGTQAFGRPLDHGDVEDAVGDQEIMPTQVGASVESPADQKMSPQAAEAIEKIVNAAGLTEMLPAKLRGFGVSKITDLTREQGMLLHAWATGTENGGGS